jgi:tetratricopeptide (TPR) repeat protein
MPDEWQQLLLERFEAGDLFNLQTVNDGFQRPQDANDWTLAYCQSHLYARYMVERFGDDALTRLLDAYRRNLATEAAIPEVFAVELDDFESGYSAFIELLVDDLHAQRSPPWPELDAAEAAYNADTKDPEAAGRYAVALMRAERFRDAGRIAAEAVELDPHQPDANYVRARFSIARQDDAQAVERLVAGLDEANPHSEVLAQLARLRLDAEENEEAARLYEIGSKLYPAEDRWSNGLAVALWRLDDTQRLRPVLEVAAARDFDNPAVRKKLAQIALADKRYEDALRWGADALYVDILDPEVHRLLADAHIALNTPDRAARELKIVLELDPDNTEARTLLESLPMNE